METSALTNINIISEKLLPTPEEVRAAFPITTIAETTVLQARAVVRNILDGRDPRLLVVAGPCSIHDLDSAREYAARLADLAKRTEDSLVILMRVYFEKPRTAIGWKGFINDPFLDDTFQIDKGLHLARGFLLELAERKLPVATEALDPITPQYLSDLISWTAIGARTTESQTHRELASGLSTPVGFKNGTDGSIEVAINALRAAASPHRFLGITQDGRCAVFHTAGNCYGHIVLRGGTRPNYDSVSVRLCEDALRKARLPVNIVIDCSHGNSLKNHTLQPLVLKDCVEQILAGNKSIVGVMLESNLKAGSQSIDKGKAALEPGVSVTDACISWEETEELLLDVNNTLKEVLKKRKDD